MRWTRAVKLTSTFSVLSCRFSAMTMKAVGTAAMEMVQEVECQFDEVRVRSTVRWVAVD